MSIEKLKKEQQLINEKIEQFAQEKGLSDDVIAPIYDGVADIEKYLSCGKKIMWVLKEPYDDSENGKPVGGGWSIVDDCFSGHGENGKSPKGDAWSNPTCQPIIYSMYGYFTGLTWESMDWIRDEKSMANILQQIAYINVSKMPNKTQSSLAQIQEFYNIWKPILFEQIDLFKPDVIIFCSTFQYFKNDLEITENDLVTKSHVQGVLDPYKKDGKLWLDVYHPNQRMIKREEYVNSIINAIKIDDE
jgi:hypothetical protein